MSEQANRMVETGGMPVDDVEGEIVNCVAYAAGQPLAHIGIEAVGDVLMQPDRFVWIGLHEPCEDLLRQVQREFGLHDLAVEDAHRAHQRPKVELYGDAVFVVLRTAQVYPERQQVAFGETHIFVGARYVVSVRHGPSLPYVEVRARCEAAPHLLSKGPAFALYALLDFIVDQYFPVVDVLEGKLEALEERIFRTAGFSRTTTTQVYQLQREMIELKRAVGPLIDICNRLMRFDLTVFPEDARVYLRDVYDHAIRLNEMVDTLRELLATALEANFSLISIRQNEVMQLQNEIMKRFGGWAAIIAVPTMIAGIYGMNFEHMPELAWPFGYPLALLLAFSCSALLFFYFRRARWI